MLGDVVRRQVEASERRCKLFARYAIEDCFARDNSFGTTSTRLERLWVARARNDFGQNSAGRGETRPMRVDVAPRPVTYYILTATHSHGLRVLHTTILYHAVAAAAASHREIHGPSPGFVPRPASLAAPSPSGKKTRLRDEWGLRLVPYKPNSYSRCNLGNKSTF